MDVLSYSFVVGFLIKLISARGHCETQRGKTITRVVNLNVIYFRNITLRVTKKMQASIFHMYSLC